MLREKTDLKMARTGGYRRPAVWRPCGVTPHAALQNKSVVCSGSRVTISTVMKLRWSVKRGGIIVKRIQRALAHIYIYYPFNMFMSTKHTEQTSVTWMLKSNIGPLLQTLKMRLFFLRLFFLPPPPPPPFVVVVVCLFVWFVLDVIFEDLKVTGKTKRIIPSDDYSRHWMVPRGIRQCRNPALWRWVKGLLTQILPDE